MTAPSPVSPPPTSAPSQCPFLWGVATSAYQVEGGYNGEAEPQNNWAWAEHHGHVGHTGRCVDFRTHAREDFARCRNLGLNAFRLSLDWSRIQPTHELPGASRQATTPPPFDHDAIRHYAQLIADCRSAELEPVVTLHHFTHPAWLGIDAWLQPETVDHFITYVRTTLRDLLSRLDSQGVTPPSLYVTINEPNMLVVLSYLGHVMPSGCPAGLPVAAQALSHLLQAHCHAYEEIHAAYADAGLPRPRVTCNNYASDLYWIDTALLDLLFAPTQGVPRHQLCQHLHQRARKWDANMRASGVMPRRSVKSMLGWLVKKLHHRAAPGVLALPCWQPLIDLLYNADHSFMDIVSFDYYDPFAAHLIRFPYWGDFDMHPRNWRDFAVESVFSKWWDWRHRAQGLGLFVRERSTYGLPILIAENGMAKRREMDNTNHPRRDGLTRAGFIRDHVRQVAGLAAEGYPLIGYLHWSLIDNYEWGSFTPRFGLYAIDFTRGLDRLPADQEGEDAPAVYAAEVRRARQLLSASVH